jgi:hypothetical protein
VDGKIGKPPDWYSKVQVAKYLGIPVPEIVNVPLWWIDRAHIAMTAEAQAQKIKAQH